MKRIRTAVVGLGRIGWQFHAPQIANHAEFEFVAAVDPIEDRLREAGERWGMRGYAQYDAMLAAEKPDLVVIASPTPFHVAQVLAAFRAGCDVFCDKPIAPTLADTDVLIRAMEAQGRKLMVYQPHRAGADMVGLRALLAEGLIGDVYMIKRASSNYSRRNDWQAFQRNGGGMLNNYGAHYIDQTLNLAGSPARRIVCALRAVATLGDADDVVKAVIETENGIVLDLDISQAAALPISPWQVFGRRGAMALDEKAKVWRVRYVAAGEMPAMSLQQGYAAEARRYGNGETLPWRERTLALADVTPVDVYRKCYEYYALGQPPFVPVAETRELMRVLEACRKDAGWQTIPSPAP